MAGLPLMPNRDRIRKHSTVKFGGLDHNKSAADGAIYDMRNMTSDDYPLLSTRKKRYQVRSVASPRGICAHDGLYYVDGTKLKIMTSTADATIGYVSDTDKVFAAMGSYLLVFPDKKYYNKETGVFGELFATYTGSAGVTSGMYAGENAENNTVVFYDSSPMLTSKFKVGDSVTVKASGHDDVIAVIREMTNSKLVFYENTFPFNVAQTVVTVSRDVPDLDFICTNENRLWGCKGDRIYASKLGDPFNWNVFDGISTDSFQADVGSAGDFTACFSYRGYPCFFKEDYIYKVYGSKPANFQVMASASLGVKNGAHKSLAVAGEVLFYVSRAGVMAYSGGIPQNVSDALGDVELTGYVGGSDGRKYYLTASPVGGGDSRAYVYDTTPNLWHVETMPSLIGMAWHNGLYYLTSGGQIWRITGDATTADIKESVISSFVEFGDFVEGDPNRKGVSKLQLRVELDDGAKLTVETMFDSSGIWEEVKVLETPRKRSFYLPITPRRCDHYKIRLSGEGAWTLYSLVRESYSGSEI